MQPYFQNSNSIANETSTSLGNRMEIMEKTFSLRTRTRFGTWNVRTLRKDTSIEQLCQEFQRLKLQVLGICEARLRGHGQLRTRTGETLLYSGKQDESGSGVGILI